jgi:tetratricopeptide (TPR) repeat protein
VARRKPSRQSMSVLAAELEGLRVSCGSPPYAQLYKISAMLPPATVSGVLNARTAPKLAFLLAFVRAVLAHADANDLPVPAAERDLAKWRSRWGQLYAPASAPDRARVADDWQASPRPQDQPRATVPWQLPAAPRLLLGRERELARLDEFCQQASDDSGPLTLILHGRAGIGKTALALGWAHRRRDQFPDGQLYADFSAGTGVRELTTAEVLIGFLAALGYSPGDLPADESGMAGMFRSAVAARTLLVVLENAERASDVRPFLPGSGRSIVLVTARDRIRGLVIYDGASTEPVPELSPVAAVELLKRHAPSLTVEQAHVLAGACGYLPLPMRIAADTLQGEDGSAALLELVNSLTSEQHAGDAPPLGAILTWSLGARSRAETAAFAALSLLSGRTFDLHEAAALLGMSSADALRIVSMLASNHLISAIGSRHYELHPLVREWVSRVVADELSAESCQEARKRLFGYYLWTADAMDRMILPQRRRPPMVTSLPRPASAPRLATPAAACSWAESNLSNMTTAVVQAERSDDQFAYLLPHVLTSFLNLRKPWPQWKQMCQSGVRVASRHGRSEDVGHLTLSLGIVLRETQRPAEAAAAFRRARSSYGRAGNPAGQAMALNNLATVYSQLHHPEQAVTALTKALALLDQTQEPFRTAIALHNLAEAELQTGQLDSALEHVKRARDIALEVEDRAGAALSLATLADVYDRLGQWSEAVTQYRNALAAQAETGDSFGQINAHRKLGQLLIRHGHPASGAVHLDNAARIEESLGSLGNPVAVATAQGE